MKLAIIFLLSFSLFAETQLQIDLSRPESCPLRSQSYQQIMEQIRTVRNSLSVSCEEAASAQVAELDNNIGEISTVVNDNSTSLDTTAGQTAQIGNAFSTLSSIATNSECFYDINRRGLFPVLADVILNVSQMGLLLARGDSLSYATTGLLVGTTLKVLISIFRRDYDFSDASERRSFLNLNCAFFDVRQSIEESGLLLTDSPLISQELEQAQERLPSLEEQRDNAVKQLETYQEQKENEIQMAILADLGETLVQFKQKMAEFSTAVTIPVTNNWEQRSFLQSVLLVAQDLKQVRPESLGLNFIQELDYQMFIEQLQSMEDNYLEVVGLGIDTFTAEIYYPLNFHNEWISDYLQSREDDARLAFLGSLHTSGEETVEEYFDSNLEALQDAVTSTENAFTSTESRITVLEDIINDENFSYTDEGDNNKTEILENFQAVVDTIYGRVGKNFMDYVLDESRENMARFSRYNNDFQEDFVGQEDLNSIENLQACQSANFLRTSYVYTQTFTELGHDFIMTNLGIFHSFIAETRRVAGVPIRTTSQRRLNDHAISILLAKAILDGQDVDEDVQDEFLSSRRLSRRSFGRIMLDLQANYSSHQAVQDFYLRNNCGEIF